MFVMQLERKMAIFSCLDCISHRSLCDKEIQEFQVLAVYRDLGRGVNATARGDLTQIAQI